MLFLLWLDHIKYILLDGLYTGVIQHMDIILIYSFRNHLCFNYRVKTRRWLLLVSKRYRFFFYTTDTRLIIRKNLVVKTNKTEISVDFCIIFGRVFFSSFFSLPFFFSHLKITLRITYYTFCLTIFCLNLQWEKIKEFL